MSERRNWFKFYPADYLLDDNEDWPIEAHGIFIRLLCHQWKRRFLPLSERSLAKLSRVHWRTFRSLWAKYIRRKFVQDDRGFYNKRLEEERQLSEVEYLRKANAGKRGAEKRWQSHRQKKDSCLGNIETEEEVEEEREKIHTNRPNLSKDIQTLLSDKHQIIIYPRWNWSQLPDEIDSEWVLKLYDAVFDPKATQSTKNYVRWLEGAGGPKNIIAHHVELNDVVQEGRDVWAEFKEMERKVIEDESGKS